MIRALFNNKQFVKLASGIDIARTANQVNSHDLLFKEQSFRQDFKGSPFKATEFIGCRMSYDFQDNPTEEELIDYLKTKGVTNTYAIDQPCYTLLPEIAKHETMIAMMLGAEEVGRVMVTKLKAGGTIGAHKDFGTYHDYYDRFHLVLSGQGCHFRCGKEIVEMLPGELWWFYNNDEHEVWNNSDADRIHLVLDLKLAGVKHV